jgi:hypothetical protein
VSQVLRYLQLTRTGKYQTNTSSIQERRRSEARTIGLVMLTPAAVVVVALGLLGRSPDSVVPIRFVETPPPGVSTNAEAFINGGAEAIYLIPSSDAFRRARQGQREPGALNAYRRIASILVHEEWHLRHGPDEEGAYLAQMTALAFLRADAATISGVKKSMLTVIQAQRRR